MTFEQFHNALRVLLNIDADEFYAAVYPKKNRYRYPDPDQGADWNDFRDNPHSWMRRASTDDAKAIWKLVEERNGT